MSELRWTLNEQKTYYTLEEYFEDHPDEEDGYYDDLAELYDREPIELPEDYAC